MVRGVARVCTKQLLNHHTIQKGSKHVVPTGAQTESAHEWLSDLGTGNLTHETQNHIRFLNRILVKVLGYDENDIKYEKSAGGVVHRKPDFTIMSKNNPLCFVEVKGSSTGLFERQARSSHQDTPFNQLQDQINNSSPRPKYGIVSNYNEFVLVTLEGGTRVCQRFMFEDINDNPERLAEFVWVFGHLVRGQAVESLHAESTEHDNEITEKFYHILNDLRLMMIRWFGNRRVTEDSITHTQTFLNRFIFVLFAEDLGLAPQKIRKILADTTTNMKNTTSYTFDAILDLFTAYESGSDDVAHFNGGLFAVPFDRNMRIYDKKDNEANPILERLRAIAKYNFKTDVSVDILGRIFEQSVSDIDKLKTNEKRSDEGVYYTPEYVTDHICRHTIIPYLSESGNATTPEELILESGDLRKLQNRLQSIRILDPACGSGAFLTKTIDVLLEIHRLLIHELVIRGVAGSMDEYVEATRIREILQDNIYGVDVSDASVGITKLAIFLKVAQIGGQLPNLDDTIKTGDSLVWDITGEMHFDWHAEFGEVFDGDRPGFDIIIGNPPYVKQARVDNKDTKQLPMPNDLGYTETIESKADLSVYFFIHSLNILKVGGMLGFINTDSWLHFKYGEQLQSALLEYCHILTLIRPKTKIFRDAQVRTVVTIAKRGDASCVVHTSAGFDQTPQMVSNVNPGNWLGMLYGSGMPEPTIPMTTLGCASMVMGGIETGHDAFYILSDDDVKKHQIDKKYLVPILTKPVSGHVIHNTSPHKFMFHVKEYEGTLVASEEGRHVKAYIDSGRPKGKSKSGNPRYYIKTKKPAPILVSMQINEKCDMYENAAGMNALRKFTYVTPKRVEHTQCLLAYLSSSYFALYQEIWGHPMGGGLLKFQIEDYKCAPVPDFTKVEVDKLNVAWGTYTKTLKQEDLDGVVFDVLGIAELLPSVRTILAEMVSGRLAAAKHATPNAKGRSKL